MTEQDIVIQGTGVEPEHCYIDSHNGVISLYPIATLCAVDGLIATKPVRLTQGEFIQFSSERISTGLKNVKVKVTLIQVDIEFVTHGNAVHYSTRKMLALLS